MPNMTSSNCPRCGSTAYLDSCRDCGYKRSTSLTEAEAPTAAAVAKEFCEVMRQYLTPAEFALAVTLNAAETDEGVCHTHDFCDANMAMGEALENLGVEPLPEGEGEEGMPEWVCDLWNQSWTLAKKAGFSL